MKRNRRNRFFRKIKKAMVSFWDFMADNKKKVMPVILLICVALTIFIAFRANRIAANKAMTEADEIENSHAVSFEVTEAALQKDAFPEVNEVVDKYLQAYASGDISILQSGIYRTLNDIEKVTVEERAKYIDEITDLAVYTKPGPVADTWVVYACSNVRYIGCDESLPAAMSLYVCKDENGQCYINVDESSQSVKDYISAVSLQDDVVDLFNRINVEYKEKLEEDPMLGELVAAIYSEIDESVGERLVESDLKDVEEEVGAEADSAGADEQAGGDQAGQADAGDTGTSGGTEDEPAKQEIPKEVKIRATTVVKVRASDSTEADVLGKAEEGDEFVCIAEQPNGWSMISYAGGAAYVKSEFFEVVDAESDQNGDAASDAAAGSSAAGDDAQEGSSATRASDAASTAASTAPSSASSAGSTASAAGSTAVTGASSSGTGSKTTTTKVRLRSKASTESEILETLEEGVKVEVKKTGTDGWSEVEYNGKKGYIKSEYLKD